MKMLRDLVDDIQEHPMTVLGFVIAVGAIMVTLGLMQ